MRVWGRYPCKAESQDDRRKINGPRINGAIATTYSADEPERLRGPQHDAAWCDELSAWRYPEAWDMLMFGMRLGAGPTYGGNDDAAARAISEVKFALWSSSCGKVPM